MELFSGFSATDEPMDLPPGFRFHPTDEELITHYLSPKVLDSSFSPVAVADIDFNKVEPWDLPWKAKMGENEWYFFCVRYRKYPTGSRTNRATEAGYWKATGKDKEIHRAKILVGMKKTLVFYGGRAPRGEKTNWVMHEYRLEGEHSMHGLPKPAKNEWVVCRVFKKSSGGKKEHISGLLRTRNLDTGSQLSDLPPLTDLSSDKNPMTAAAAAAAEGSHVTCFSNTTAEEFSSSLKNTDIMRVPSIFPEDSNPNSTFSSQTIQCTEKLHCADSLSIQDQSILRHLVENSSTSCMKQDAKAESLEDYEVGFRPYADQEFPFVSTDFDCFWNY